MDELTPYQRMTAVTAPKPFTGIPDGYDLHRWMAAPAGRPGAAAQVITGDDMSYCMACGRWFRFVFSDSGKYAVGTDGELAISCPGYDWHGPDCNCFGHPQPRYLGTAG